MKLTHTNQKKGQIMDIYYTAVWISGKLGELEARDIIESDWNDLDWENRYCEQYFAPGLAERYYDEMMKAYSESAGDVREMANAELFSLQEFATCLKYWLESMID